MKASFSEKSGMIKLAKINWNLLLSLWSGMKRHNGLLKVLLLGPVLFYSTLCLFLIVFFYIASVLDILPYIISVIANALGSLADDISKTNYGIFSTLFYPPLVFLVGIMMALAIILPKAVVMPQD